MGNSFNPSRSSKIPLRKEKIKRLGLSDSGIRFSEWDGFKRQKEQIRKEHIDFGILDSITAVDRYLRDFEDFQDWCKTENVSLVVSHATKAGSYKGDSSLAHGVDTHIWLQDHTAATKKNRYGPLAEIPVDFGKTERENPKIPHVSKNAFGSFQNIKELQKKVQTWVKEHLAGNEITNKEQNIVIHLNWQGLKKSTKSQLTENKLLSMKVIPALLKSAHLLSIEPDKQERKDIKAFYHFESPLLINGEKYSAYLTVKETKENTFYYDHNLTHIKKPGNAPGTPLRRNVHQAKKPGSAKNIRNSAKKSTNSKKNNPQRSERGHVKKARKVKKAPGVP